jgi:fimbrial chaperone protein
MVIDKSVTSNGGMKVIYKWRMPLAIAGSAIACSFLGAPALATSVQPVVLDLFATGRKTSTTVEVENDFKNNLPVEMRVEVADFVDGELKDTGVASDDLLVFPPQALIEPGRTQNFRIQYLGDPAIAASRHYIVTVVQLPIQLPGDQSVVQVLYNFQVITSVRPIDGKPAIRITGTEIETGADGKSHAVLLLENSSNTYGYLSTGTIKLKLMDEHGKTVYQKTLNSLEVQDQIGYGLIGAHQKRRLVTPLVLPSAKGTLEAEFKP